MITAQYCVCREQVGVFFYFFFLSEGLSTIMVMDIISPQMVEIRKIGYIRKPAASRSGNIFFFYIRNIRPGKLLRQKQKSGHLAYLARQYFISIPNIFPVLYHNLFSYLCIAWTHRSIIMAKVEKKK